MRIHRLNTRKFIIDLTAIYVTFVMLFISMADDSVAQSLTDRKFISYIYEPTYAELTGPAVVIDEGHNNYHTKNGGYQPFATLLEEDGYVMGSIDETFTDDSLSKFQILVIVNAINTQNIDNWVLPTPSAFTDLEIDAVEKFVLNGGSLFLIFDHMPFAGASERLANRFKINVLNGFVFQYRQDKFQTGTIVFKNNGKGIGDHSTTAGPNAANRVEQIATFTGAALSVPQNGVSILNLDDRHKALLPETAWEFNSNTKISNAEGWSQGVVFTYGSGRVAIFGEAAMFTSQRIIEFVGLRNKLAVDNQKLLLNIMRWLSKKN